MDPVQPTTGRAIESAPDSERAVHWMEAALGAALFVGTLAVVVLSRGADVAARLSMWPWAGSWYGLLALPPVAFIVGAAARRPVPRLGAALDVGLFLWAAAAVGAAWFAASRPMAMRAAVLPFSTICLAYVVRGWLGFDPAVSRRRAHDVLVVVGVAVAAVLTTAWWVPGPAATGREHGGVGLAAIALPVFIGLAASVRGIWRVTWLMAAVSAFGFVALIGGLAGRCALAATVATAGLALIATRRAFRVGWTAVAVGGALIVALCVASWTPERAARDLATRTARERTALVRAGVVMGASRPWIGHGPGMVAWVFPHYRARFSVAADEVSALPSTPVQIWAEHGVLGLVAMASLALGVGLRAWRLRPGGIAAKAGTHEDRVRAWSVVTALGAGGGFALAEFPLDAPPLLALLAALLPVLAALTRPVSDARVAWSPTFVRVLPAVAVLGGLALLGWHVWPNLRAGREFAAGLFAEARGDTERYIAAVRRARELAPWDPAYPEALARHFVREAEAAGATPRARVARTLAIGQFRQVIALQPGNVECQLELGALLSATDDPAAAVQQYRAAAHFAPDRSEIYHRLGAALVQADRAAEAIEAFACEWIIQPRAAWQAPWITGDLSPRRAAVAEAAAARAARLAQESNRRDVTEIADQLSRLFAATVPVAAESMAALPPEGWLPAQDRQRLVTGIVE